MTTQSLTTQQTEKANTAQASFDAMNENPNQETLVLMQIAKNIRENKFAFCATRKSIEEALEPFKGAAMANAMILVNTVLEKLAERLIDGKTDL